MPILLWHGFLHHHLSLVFLVRVAVAANHVAKHHQLSCTYTVQRTTWTELVFEGFPVINHVSLSFLLHFRQCCGGLFAHWIFGFFQLFQLLLLRQTHFLHLRLRLLYPVIVKIELVQRFVHHLQILKTYFQQFRKLRLHLH